MKISAIVPCRNEEQYINECITAIYACELPAECELNVFVVDGMSTDNTRATIQQLQKTFHSLVLVDNLQQLTPFAFNLGIHSDTADFYQIVGARHILSTNYLIQAYNTLVSNPAIWCVGGKINNHYINEDGEIISKAMATPFGMGLGNFRTLHESGFTDTVTSPMYPHAVFEKIGYFDEELIRNQDDDFNFRLTQAGGKIYFNAEISLNYYVRGNFKNLWRQFFQYGYWKVFVNRKHKVVTTMRQLVPPFFVAYLFTLLLAYLIHSNNLVVLALPLLFYLFIDLYLTFNLAEKSGQHLKLFITFPILHISYGLGFLKGMLDFLLLNKKPSDKQQRLSR
jgi:GT2 family glycosyltransferase